MSINSRVIRDSLHDILITADTEPDATDRYLLARELLDMAETYLQKLIDRTAYDGSAEYGVKEFAERLGVAHSAISKAAARHVAETGATDHRTRVRMRAAARFTINRSRRGG